MMNIDHAYEAQNALVRADMQGSDDLASELRVEALVHATLASAEQQRIANLIAVQHIEFLAGNKHFEASLWNDHIGPALGFDTTGVKRSTSASRALGPIN